MASRYLYHVLSAATFTSISINLLNQRRDAEIRDAKLSAQTFALQDVLRRLKEGETINDAELIKIRRRVGLVPNLSVDDTYAQAVGWKEVFTAAVSSKDQAEEMAFVEWLKGI